MTEAVIYNMNTTKPYGRDMNTNESFYRNRESRRCSCGSWFDWGLKLFLFLLMLGPCIAIACLLFALAIIANVFTLIFFALIGWLCETGVCDCCWGKFIVDSLAAPWTPLLCFLEKIYQFLRKPLL